MQVVQITMQECSVHKTQAKSKITEKTNNRNPIEQL